ncbi:MAG TPA: sigma 54-interacting transcriptional regulator [Fibrobacteria bacterium]|nr:sigma 54-interacting transcriptional regulator [Fibrobacteria bacterium]HOX52181.1 sigma 54-interacting transcriptional regulator [Fibrobacteria bacterium]
MISGWTLENRSGKGSFALERKLVLVGSAAGCDLRLPDVAPRELQILSLPGKVVLEAQSKGVKLDGAPLKTGVPQDAPEGGLVTLSDGSTWELHRAHRGSGAIEPVLQAVELLVESPEPAECLPRLLEFAAVHLAADEGVLLGGGETSDVVSTWPVQQEVTYSRSAVRAALERGGAVLWAESGEGDAPLDGPSLTRSQIRSILCATLRLPDDSSPLGCLYLHRKANASAFSEQDRSGFQRLVGMFAVVFASARRRAEEHAALEAFRSAERSGGILAFSPSMLQTLAHARKFAPASVPVLVLGETGTGKERLARLLHEASRRAGPFIAINCAAIPASLMEAELFGHEKGAFTGASSDRDGLFDAARGGTLFLDEVGELAPHLQAALLRALQEKTIRRVGSTQERPVDVRIVAATHRDLEAMVRTGAFRQDLLFRLNVATISIAPLRDRPEDILPLARVFAQKASAEFGVPFSGLSRSAEKTLMRHGWPGNVRELENCLQRSILEAGGARIQPEHMGLKEEEQPLGTLAEIREAAERRATESALARSGGNLTQAAGILGIDRKVLRDLLRRLGMYEASSEES